MFEFWAFLFFTLVFNPVKVGAVCAVLVQKLPMGVLYLHTDFQAWGIASFQGASRRVIGCVVNLEQNCHQHTKF